tara:strand:- start:638 stop:1141 length:504 start_codon:yes stop_codon:yes gene_type:complete
MQKKVLSEQTIYYGDVKMPKGFDIDPFEMSKTIFESIYKGEDTPFSRNWDKLNKYIIEHIRVKYNLNLVNKKTWGKMYFPNDKTDPIIEVNPVDLKNSPDFVCLYGVNAVDCNVKIYYDDNRRKGRSWDIPLTHNKFIMFPATNLYYVENNQKGLLNFVQTILYEYV